MRALAAHIAERTGTVLGYLSEGANAAGAQLAGLLPHRGQGGRARQSAGCHAANMLDEPLDAVVLLNVEPDADLLACVDATSQLTQQKFVIAMSPFVSATLLECADLLLPIGTAAETAGTYVNVAGTWQSFPGIAKPVGDARPCWKVLRVLGNLLEAPNFDYVTSEEVRDEIVAQLGEIAPDNHYRGTAPVAAPNGADAPAAEIDTPMYSVDGLVRRANALQLTTEARRAATQGVAT